MNIYNDIEKATQIPCTNENASFVRVKKSKKKRIKHHSVENENLYEDTTDNDNDTVPEWCLNETEIACAISEANGGVSYSNENLEDHWKSKQLGNRQRSSNASLKSGSTSPVTDGNLRESSSQNNNKESISNVDSERNNRLRDTEEALKQCKLSKNAAITGLLNCNKISVQDLQIPHNSNSNENIPPINDADQDKYRMKLVQYSEDPEFFLQPLQAYGKIDENKYKEIDFTVPHIGKKTVVTPRQYYIREIDDSSFQFKRKDRKCKK